MGLTVVKLGSSIVAEQNGGLRSDVFSWVGSDVAALRKAGEQVIIVTSGAIALGVSAIDLESRPKALDELQAASAIGQGALYQAWESQLKGEGLIAAQVLLTLHDISERSSSLNVAATLRRLLTWGAVPVVNENDTTTTDEITFGDNDLLASQVAILLGAQRLVLLTEVEGLHETDPREDPQSAIVSDVVSIKELDSFSIGQSANSLGSGGMRSKVVAAEMATSAGIETTIASGLQAGTLLAAVTGKSIGTRFHASETKIGSFKAWLRYAKPASGRIIVDQGAAKALQDDGTSLLAVGVTEVEGRFEAGDAVEVVFADRVLGKGLASLSADQLSKVMGMKSEQIRELLPMAASEVIHRDRFASA